MKHFVIRILFAVSIYSAHATEQEVKAARLKEEKRYDIIHQLVLNAKIASFAKNNSEVFQAVLSELECAERKFFTNLKRRLKHDTLRSVPSWFSCITHLLIKNLGYPVKYGITPVYYDTQETGDCSTVFSGFDLPLGPIQLGETFITITDGPRAFFNDKWSLHLASDFYKAVSLAFNPLLTSEPVPLVYAGPHYTIKAHVPAHLMRELYQVALHTAVYQIHVRCYKQIEVGNDISNFQHHENTLAAIKDPRLITAASAYVNLIKLRHIYQEKYIPLKQLLFLKEYLPNHDERAMPWDQVASQYASQIQIAGYKTIARSKKETYDIENFYPTDDQSIASLKKRLPQPSLDSREIVVTVTDNATQNTVRTLTLKESDGFSIHYS